MLKTLPILTLPIFGDNSNSGGVLAQIVTLMTSQNRHDLALFRGLVLKSEKASKAYCNSRSIHGRVCPRTGMSRSTMSGGEEGTFRTEEVEVSQESIDEVLMEVGTAEVNYGARLQI